MGILAAARRPASATAGLVDRLAQLDDDEVLDVLVGLQRAQSRLAWAESQALVRLAGPYTREHEVVVVDPASDAERVVFVVDEVRDEIAAALHRSANVVHDQITTARLLNGVLAPTAAALRDGRITPAHVRVIGEQVRRLPGAALAAHDDPARDTPIRAAERRQVMRTCARLQERVLPAAMRQVPSQTRALAKRVLAAVDEHGEQKRRAAARCTRDVWVSPDEDGLATLVARLDALTAQAIRAAVDAAALDPQAAGDCGSTVGERRAEALAALVLGSVQVAVQVEVTMPLDALTGPGAGAATVVGDAVLPDGTLIDCEAVRVLLDEPSVVTHLRGLVLEPASGRALDLGRTRYQVSEPLRRWIAARDRTCRFPGCRRRARTCQIDHIDPWDDGGATDAHNLQALCTRHHQLKTHSGWRVARDAADGVTTWISPLGRAHPVDPEPVCLPRTAPDTLRTDDPDPPPF